MIDYINSLVKITCDKCGFFETARKSNYNQVFYELGWSLNPKAKKYLHRCYQCLTRQERKAKVFVMDKFGGSLGG